MDGTLGRKGVFYMCVCLMLFNGDTFSKRRNDVSFFPFVQAQIIVWVFAKSFYKKCTNENSENIGKAGVQLERNTINNYVTVPNDIKCKNENSSCSSTSWIILCRKWLKIALIMMSVSGKQSATLIYNSFIHLRSSGKDILRQWCDWFWSVLISVI